MKSHVDDIVVIYDEIVDTSETTSINPNDKKILICCYFHIDNRVFTIDGADYC